MVCQRATISPFLSKTSQSDDLLLLGSVHSKRISHTDNNLQESTECLERHAWFFRSQNLCCTVEKATLWYFVLKFHDFLPPKHILIDRMAGISPKAP